MSTSYDEFLSALKRRLPREQLDALGRSCGFVQRLRRINASEFVWAVILSRFGHGAPAFEHARRWFERLARCRIWPRPFQMRFKSSAAVHLFQSAFEQAVAPWRTPSVPVKHRLQRFFPDVVLWDATPIALADSLRPRFKGLRNVASQLKVLLAVSAFSLRPLAARLVPGSFNDLCQPPPLDLLRRGSLLLFDNGFVTYRVLREIQGAQMFYLCRMRCHGAATIVGIHSAPATVQRALKQSKTVALREHLPRDKKINRVWDLDVLVYPTNDPVPVRTRLVIVPGPNGEQRPYLTNLGTVWQAPALGELYRLRWQIELVFKELKQHLSLEAVATKDPNAVQVLVWASLLALAVSRTVATSLLPDHAPVGLAATFRPALVSRALRAASWALGTLLLSAGRRGKLLLLHIVDCVETQARQSRKRRDSFHRLNALLPA